MTDTQADRPGGRGYHDNSFDTPGPPPGTDVITIDYGQYFTERTGLPRSAKNRKPAIQYGGFPAGWKWSEKNKVHFICHSQGGLTVRLLIKLMQGDFSSRHSKYFTVTGRDSWTKSVVTLGTPHNGTTIIDVLRVSLRCTPSMHRETALTADLSIRPTLQPSGGN